MLANHEAMKLLEDEQFCIAYELGTLSKIVTQEQLERWVAGFSYDHTEREHTSRYQWVSNFVSGRTVLDIACGTGRGCLIMAKEGNAKKVTGCDIDPKTVRYASIRNKHDHVNFFAQNGETFTSDCEYDVIVSFETIEHIANVESFLEHIRESLSNMGQLFISTPIISIGVNEKPDNRHLLREWGFFEFQKIISAFFKIDKIYLQLYPPTKSKWKGILNLNKNLKMNDAISAPQLWDPKIIPTKELGKKRNGYQIIQCSK